MAKKEDKNKTTFKKGLVAGVLGFTMMASSAGMLTACGPQRGPEGATGATGKSAYELAVENGFEGTLGEWLESLRGQSGGAGNSGNGIESVVKTDSDGLVDTYTITFTDGTFTTFEITNGEQCTNWLSGEGEPLSYTGNVGDFYMDTENFVIYKKVSTGWEFVTQIAQKEPDMYYYDSINAAIDAVNGGDFTTSNAQVSESEAKIAVYEKEGVPHIKLMNHPVTTSLLNITRDMVIELNGKIISCVGTDAIQVQSANVKIDGSVPGSAISVMSDKISSTVLRVVSGKCSIYGGKYEAFSYKLGTPDAPNPCMLVEDSADLYLENVDVVAMETTTGTMQGVIVKRGGEAYISNSKITVTAPDALDVAGIVSDGEVVAINSEIVAKSNYTANAEKTNYATCSRGVVNTGILTLKDCYVAGTHSGLRAGGTVYIDGGIFEGYGHGGIYFMGEGRTSYVKNATIRQMAMFDGYIDDGIAGTNQSGMYVGGANNMTIYMDNCEFSGNYYPLVMKKSCSGNKLYISNSNINLNCQKYIRLDTDANKLYIGVGNNFNIVEHCAIESAAELTDEDYLFKFPVFRV